MFNAYSGSYNFMDIVTVTDGLTEGYNETEIYVYTTIYFRKGKDCPTWVILASICIVVQELKLAGPLKSGTSLFSQIYRRCVLY
jgi:hypothetical protein